MNWTKEWRPQRSGPRGGESFYSLEEKVRHYLGGWITKFPNQFEAMTPHVCQGIYQKRWKKGNLSKVFGIGHYFGTGGFSFMYISTLTESDRANPFPPEGTHFRLPLDDWVMTKARCMLCILFINYTTQKPPCCPQRELTRPACW